MWKLKKKLQADVDKQGRHTLELIYFRLLHTHLKKQPGYVRAAVNFRNLNFKTRYLIFGTYRNRCVRPNENSLRVLNEVVLTVRHWDQLPLRFTVGGLQDSSVGKYQRLYRTNRPTSNRRWNTQRQDNAWDRNTYSDLGCCTRRMWNIHSHTTSGRHSLILLPLCIP